MSTTRIDDPIADRAFVYSYRAVTIYEMGDGYSGTITEVSTTAIHPDRHGLLH